MHYITCVSGHFIKQSGNAGSWGPGSHFNTCSTYKEHSDYKWWSITHCSQKPMTKIKWNEFSLQITAVSSHRCHVTRGQDFVSPLTSPPLLSILQLRICILIYCLTGRWGSAPAAPPSPGSQPGEPEGAGWVKAVPSPAPCAAALEQLPVAKQLQGCLCLCCTGGAARAPLDRWRGAGSMETGAVAVAKPFRPWLAHGAAGKGAGERRRDTRRSRGRQEGRGGERQHMCTAEVTKAADPGRAGGTQRGERNGREAKGTVQN